jgi:hypothetical protein
MTFSPRGRAALALAVSTAVLGFACGSSSSSSSSGGNTTPTFTEVYTNVIVRDGKCATTACHAPGSESIGQFLDMSTQANAYKNLVGVKAGGSSGIATSLCSSSGLTRVVPGSPSKSLLYLKISESAPPCGVEMPDYCPRLEPCLSAADQAEVEAWIMGGALND